MARVNWGGKQFAMLGTALIVGILVSLQWTVGSLRRPVSADQVGQTIRQLELEQSELKRQVSRLRDELNDLQQDAVTSTQMLDGLRQELANQKASAGLIDVRGPGVRVLLDDGDRAPAGRADDVLVHDFDLRDVIGVLWLAGAEAIAVNGERIVFSTSIYCVGSTVMVNDTRLSPPYEVRAIGDPSQLQDHLRNPGYLSDLKARHDRVGLTFEVMRVDAMIVAAYQGSVLQRYAKPGVSGR